MRTPALSLSISKAMPRLGAGLTGLVVLFLAFDGITKVLHVAPVVEACQKAGLLRIWSLASACSCLPARPSNIIPRTAILGAILLTGYLGGAVTIHVIARAGSFAIFLAVGFGVLVWAGLAVREPRLVWLVLLRQC
jgi:DoxX-like family